MLVIAKVLRVGEWILMNCYSEKNWKLFRQKLPQWQESHMEKLCGDYLDILRKDTQPSDRFWQLEKRINDDKHHIGIRVRMSRSNMDINILNLIREGVITLDDPAEFSDELQSNMRLIVERTLMIFDDYDSE